VVRWIGEPEWIARPPKEGAAKTAGRTAVRVVRMVEAFIFSMVGRSWRVKVVRIVFVEGGTVRSEGKMGYICYCSTW
jgi:hypothetical protein